MSTPIRYKDFDRPEFKQLFERFAIVCAETKVKEALGDEYAIHYEDGVFDEYGLNEIAEYGGKNQDFHNIASYFSRQGCKAANKAHAIYKSRLPYKNL